MTESAILIRPLDLTAASAAEWAAFHEFRRARHAESRGDDPPRSDQTVEIQERDPSRYYRPVGWAAWDGDRMVGYVQAQLPDADQPEFAAVATRAVVFGSVRCDWRRRGIGSRLLSRVRTLMAETGRTVVMLTTEEPDGHAFLSRIGAEQTLRYQENRVALGTIDWDLVERWRAALPAGLTVTVHAGRVPLAEFQRLLPTVNAMIRDIPRDRLSTPVLEDTLPMIEDWYRLLEQRRGEHHMVVIEDDRAGDGRAGDDRNAPVALSDLSWFPDAPDRAGHVFTGVRRDRRGQGLGKAVKAAVLLHLRAALPGVRLLTTGSNEVNAPMLAINRQLGFVTHRTGGHYEIATDALPAG